MIIQRVCLLQTAELSATYRVFSLWSLIQMRSVKAYRYGVAVLDAMNVEQGTYIAIISTFKPMQKGPFKFTVKSVENLQLKVV